MVFYITSVFIFEFSFDLIKVILNIVLKLLAVCNAINSHFHLVFVGCVTNQDIDNAHLFVTL